MFRDSIFTYGLQGTYTTLQEKDTWNPSPKMQSRSIFFKLSSIQFVNYSFEQAAADLSTHSPNFPLAYSGPRVRWISCVSDTYHLRFNLRWKKIRQGLNYNKNVLDALGTQTPHLVVPFLH